MSAQTQSRLKSWLKIRSATVFANRLLRPRDIGAAKRRARCDYGIFGPRIVVHFPIRHRDRPRASFPVGSASIILGKVELGRFFYFFVTRSEPFREFSSPLELIKLFVSSQSRHLASLLASMWHRTVPSV